LADPDIAADLARTFRAGLASGVKGAALDMRCLCRGWRLDLGALNMPGRMWLGGQDGNVPLPAARKLAELIDTLDIIEIDDAGHLWVTKHYLQVLEWLNETMRGNSHRKRTAGSLEL
jgi:pimeloyl-ACP methyl ester carboxylesterase